MTAGTRRFLKIFGLTVALFLAGITTLVLGIVFQAKVAIYLGVLLLLAAIGLPTGLVARFVLRRLLFRVGRRLLVSFLLLALVPIPLFLLSAWAVAWISAAHVASMRVDREIDRTILELRNLLLEADAELSAQGAAVDPTEPLARAARYFPGVEILYRAPGGAWSTGASDPNLLLPEDRVWIDLAAVGVVDDEAHLMVVERTERGVLLARLRFEPELSELLQARTRVTIGFPVADRPYTEVDGMEISNQGLELDLEEDDAATEAAEGFVDGLSEGMSEEPPIEARDADKDADRDTGVGAEVDAPRSRNNVRLDRPPPASLGGPLAWPIVAWPRNVQLPYMDWLGDDWHGATEVSGDDRFLFVLRTSIAREAEEVASSEGFDLNETLSLAAQTAISIFATSSLILWLTAALLAGVLVWRIARASDRLASGFQAVEDGRFEYRARLDGHDQLSELVDSFNRMAAHLERSVEERAEREALERELSVARELQRSLLPPPGFSFPGLEVATHFEPAQAIGGDFYHFTGRESSLDVVVADVSGHGLGTGIVMAAAKTLLSALAAEGQDTVDLFERLDRELRANTDARTFVTLVHLRVDRAFEGGDLVRVTNAGHPPAYRVEPDGTVSALSEAARPLGLGLPAEFHTVAAEASPGDLWVLLSDGLIEAVSPRGDLFGFERWERLLAETAGLGAAAARDHILDAWSRFVGDEEPEDDRTLLVVRIDERPSDGDGD